MSKPYNKCLNLLFIVFVKCMGNGKLHAVLAYYFIGTYNSVSWYCMPYTAVVCTYQISEVDKYGV